MDNIELALESFAEKGIGIIDDFLPVNNLDALRTEIRERMAHGSLRHAAVGKSAERTVNADVRGDFISWIDPLNDVGVVALYVQHVQHTMTILNRSFYLGLRDFEAHLTHYPEGSFYKRHTDRHRDGSHRKVSFILYLNEDWKSSDGGELVLYPANGSTTSIEPIDGRFAFFLSEIEHEVLPTRRERKSITGWMLDEKVFF
jgi:SM-20-related protein